MAQKTEISLFFQNLPKALENLRLVQLSDLHMGFWTSSSFLNEITDEIDRFKPDIICFTGDFLIRGQVKREAELLLFLQKLKAPFCFACLGNHDYEGKKPKNSLISLLKQTSFHLLHNETLLIKDLNTQIVGLGDIKPFDCLPEKAFEKSDQALFTLVLTHNPDSIPKLDSFRKDLILAGHTHGGQINLPLVWNLHTRLKNKAFKRGLIRKDTSQIYVNRGLGHHTLFRLFSPPEVLFATLRTL
jgi:predicted MPP superfamily phosphohydrolase